MKFFTGSIHIGSSARVGGTKVGLLIILPIAAGVLHISTRKSSFGELLMFIVYPIFHDVGWSVASDNLIITFPINFRVVTMCCAGGWGGWVST